MVMKCGASKKIINPPSDIGDLYIAGYMTMMAPKIKDVHDNIHVRALVLFDGFQKITMVSVECIGLLADFIKKVKQRLSAYDFPHKNVFIFSTHTHAGPDTMGLWGPIIGKSGINKKYSLFLINAIVNAVLEAESKLIEVDLFYVESKLEKLIENYRDENDINGDLKILKFQSGSEPVGCLWVYSAQPEITTRENVSISADYPGLVCDMIEKDFGGVSLFAMGLCGAQSPIYCEQGFEKMKNFADDLYSEIRNIFSNSEKLEIAPIEIRHRNIKIKLENPDFQLLFKIGIFERELQENEALTTISKIRIGKIDIVHIPGEPFPKLFSKIIENNNDKNVMVISNSNDSIGYLIPLEQYSLKPQVWVDNIENGKFIGHETESVGSEAAEVVRKTVKELFVYKNVLAIGPHADDLTIWAGGTLSMLADEGNHLICVRITDDFADCVGITKEKAITRNRIEVERAYKALGAEEIIHLDYPTDTLSVVDYYELRGKLIRLIRKYKPDLVVSFDLNGIDEENMDHIICAQAVNEACWQSSFHLFYPEQFEEGLEIHAVGERYLFARNPTVINFYVDITDYVENKIKVINEHKTVLKNWFYQNLLLARANRLYIELLEEDVPNAIRVNLLVKIVYGEIGEKYGVKYAEEFNKIDAGFLKDLASD
ncbi:MAG: PIG-L deacetylase family protein [Candidatus Hodarchaeota archaeon]